MSPHVLIDEELDAMADPATPKSWQAMVLKLLTEMLADQRITIEAVSYTHLTLPTILLV